MDSSGGSPFSSDAVEEKRRLLGDSSTTGCVASLCCAGEHLAADARSLDDESHVFPRRPSTSRRSDAEAYGLSAKALAGPGEKNTTQEDFLFRHDTTAPPREAGSSGSRAPVSKCQGAFRTASLGSDLSGVSASPHLPFSRQVNAGTEEATTLKPVTAAPGDSRAGSVPGRQPPPYAPRKEFCSESRVQALLSRLTALQDALDSKSKTIIAQQETVELQKREITELESTVATLTSQVLELEEALTVRRPGCKSAPVSSSSRQEGNTGPASGSSRRDTTDSARIGIVPVTPLSPKSNEMRTRALASMALSPRALLDSLEEENAVAMRQQASCKEGSPCSPRVVRKMLDGEDSARSQHDQVVAECEGVSTIEDEDGMTGFSESFALQDLHILEAILHMQIRRRRCRKRMSVVAASLEKQAAVFQHICFASLKETLVFFLVTRNVRLLNGLREFVPQVRQRARAPSPPRAAVLTLFSRFFSLALRANSAQWLQLLVEVLEAERGSVFLWDPTRSELFTRCATGGLSRAVRVKSGSGIAGTVYCTGEPLVVQDPSSCRRVAAGKATNKEKSSVLMRSRFNPVVDKRTNFRTRNICCVPLKLNAKVIGCIQLLNKLHDLQFDSDDVQFLQIIGDYVSHAFTYSPFIDDQEAVEQAEALWTSYALENATTGPLHSKTTNPVLHWLARALAAAFDAAHCSVWIFSGSCNRLSLEATTLQIGAQAGTEPRSALAERVLEFGATINIVDVSKDARFVPGAENPLPGTTRNLVCVPLVQEGQDFAEEPRGCVQLFNKIHGVFSSADTRKLQGFVQVIHGLYEGGCRTLSLSCAVTHLQQIFSRMPAATFLIGRGGVIIQANDEATSLTTKLASRKGRPICPSGVLRAGDGSGHCETGREQNFPVGLSLSDLWLPEYYELYEMWTACLNSGAEVTKTVHLAGTSEPKDRIRSHVVTTEKDENVPNGTWIARAQPFPAAPSKKQPFCCMFSLLELSCWYRGA
ncbi:3 5 -cyclic nucleotide phosphodiesterase related protein [Cystoisospora suis]|uniref:3 5-cyclic nucleotide phosphodiesterase related protein n=1 Tax=Cystoisospora suis TaxID=483139 RepID=A0A2C6L7S3_9APIC|nr:3 5 -cyclic nucleotide phosphodiesterase related protein [Cystoisospora suis]